MRLPAGGIDIFYIDESTDRELLVMSAVTIPFLRLIEGTWNVVWEDHLNNIREWRRRLSRDHGIPVRKELKGGKLASGRGRYLLGQHQLQRPADADDLRQEPPPRDGLLRRGPRRVSAALPEGAHESEHSLFIQLADLLSYAALLKLRGERSALTDWQHALELGRLYDVVPVQALNTFASRTDPQGLVRLG